MRREEIVQSVNQAKKEEIIDKITAWLNEYASKGMEIDIKIDARKDKENHKFFLEDNI